jgi:NitT/TauT family transport system permease protein
LNVVVERDARQMMLSRKEHPAGRNVLRRTTDRLASGPLLVATILTAWEFLVRLVEARPTSIPSPSRVLLELWRQAPQFREHATVTLIESMEGLLLALVAGLALGTIAAWRASFRRIASVLLSILGCVPLITLAPLMIIWFGYGFPSAVANSFVVCFLPMLSLLLAGFSSLPAETEETLRTMGAGRAIVYLKVRLPACLPYLTRALKVSIPLAFAGAAVAEFVGSDSGLGFLMQYAGSRADATPLFAALAVLILMILCLNALIVFVERKWIPWPVEVFAWPGAVVRGATDSPMAD